MNQLNAMRARDLAMKRPIAVPKPAQIAHESRQNAASTPAITKVSRSTSPPTVVWAARAPSADTQAFGFIHVKSVASKRPIGFTRQEPLLASARAIRQAR